MSQVFVVQRHEPSDTKLVATYSSFGGAERGAVQHMAQFVGREPWIQTGRSTWELKAQRLRVDITSCPVLD